MADPDSTDSCRVQLVVFGNFHIWKTRMSKPLNHLHSTYLTQVTLRMKSRSDTILPRGLDAEFTISRSSTSTADKFPHENSLLPHAGPVRVKK